MKALALVDGVLTEVEIGAGGGAITELNVDPDPPSVGQAWVLKTLENPQGTLSGFVGGFPVVTQQDDNKYEFSFRTAAGTTIRTLMT